MVTTIVHMAIWRYQHTPGLGPGSKPDQEQHHGLDTNGNSLYDGTSHPST